MGGKPTRATHFQRPTEEEDMPEELPDDHHISISNKMVERLVEDATMSEGVPLTHTATRGAYKDKIYMERLKCMDESHSERTGLTIEDMNKLASRIEYRTANMVSTEPVCDECKQKVIQCYDALLPEEHNKCWDIVDEFSACVAREASCRVEARSARAAREHARLDRHVALARKHQLKDLGSHGDSATT